MTKTVAPSKYDQAESAATLRVASTISWLSASNLLYREQTMPVPANLTGEFMDRLSFASRLIVEQSKPGQIVTLKVRT